MKIIKERSSNIEMLRIIAMLLIVMHHYSLHSNFQFDPTSIQLNHVFVQSLQVGGKIGVAIFVIVMGYFSVYSGYKKTKAIKLWAEICFYSVSGMFIVSLLNKTLNSLTVERIIYAFFPITSFQYWFATTYFILYLLVPYINKMIINLSSVELKKLISLLLIVWSVIPTFFELSVVYSQLGLFVLLYLIGAYLRLFPDKFTTNYKYGLLITVGVYFFYIICIIVFDYAGKYNPHLGKYATYGAEENSIFTIVCAVSLFCCFKNLKIKNSKYINYFAQSMFGVYLVHDNNYVRYFLWREIFKSNEKIYSRYFVLYSIGIIFLVFCCSVFIDIFRREVLVKRVLLKRILNRRKGYE
ncbi:acyltransferase [Lacrimispora saccharolytica]|nr:acyltransferase [Lacrimispora saccharolytica]